MLIIFALAILYTVYILYLTYKKRQEKKNKEELEKSLIDLQKTVNDTLKYCRLKAQLSAESAAEVIAVKDT